MYSLEIKNVHIFIRKQKCKNKMFAITNKMFRYEWVNSHINKFV